MTDFAPGGSAFSSAIESGDVYADDGSVHKSIQSAVDSATALVIIGPGTFNEAVSVGSPNMVITGSGTGTTVDGGSDVVFNVTGTSVAIQNMTVKSTNFLPVYLRRNFTAARRIKCNLSGGQIVQTTGDYCEVNTIINDASGATNTAQAQGNYSIFDNLINSAGVIDNGTGNVIGEQT